MEGKYLKDRLISEGYKIGQIADIIGVPEENIYGLLRAKNITVKTLRMISEATNKSISYWLNESEVKHITNDFEKKYYALQLYGFFHAQPEQVRLSAHGHYRQKKIAPFLKRFL